MAGHSTGGDIDLASIIRFAGQEMIEDMTDIVLLAAGRHSRFPGPEPKCLKEVDGEPIIARLKRCIPNYTPLIACRDDLEDEYISRLGNYGTLLQINNPDSQGHTMSWVLSYLQKGRVVVFISADTFPLITRPIPLPTKAGSAIFDPAAWVTILAVSNTQSVKNQMSSVVSKLDYMAQSWTSTVITYHPWTSINRPEDIATAETLLQKIREKN